LDTTPAQETDMSRHNHQARAAYERVRRQAVLNALLARLAGRPNDLLSYHETRGRLALVGQSYRGLRTVPVDRIVGSTDRVGDFDRAFRPRRAHCAGRWLSVACAHAEGKTLPPVELYQVGDAYFVLDGHHRVSVARAWGQFFIDAEVVEVVAARPRDLPAAPAAADPIRTGSAVAAGGKQRWRPRLVAGLRALAWGRGRLAPGAPRP
jgi:hypothetical protein